MSEISQAQKKLPADQEARDLFCNDWCNNYAVSANAGSGKTTAISYRLAAMAMSPDAAQVLPKTAVVTYTKKAAQQIGQRARAKLLERLAEGRANPPGEPHCATAHRETAHPEGSPYQKPCLKTNLAPLDHLERAFFGTIHAFCLLLAQKYGHSTGINLNPDVIVDDSAEAPFWEEFLQQDSMEFCELAAPQTDAFLRHVPLDNIFELARGLTKSQAEKFLKTKPAALPPGPDAAVLQELLEKTTSRKASIAGLKKNQDDAREWARRFRDEKTFLPFYKPASTVEKTDALFPLFYAPVKAWLASAGAVLAAELSLRYREWRFQRGVQTYADQIETALAVLEKEDALNDIRKDGWRVILDEAQDTDPLQFAVLVEIARPRGAKRGEWPSRGEGPRAGHFCMVGDGQQSIYGSRADIRNFLRHLDAFKRGDSGHALSFEVTFRTPCRVIDWLNRGFPHAFGEEREHNRGLPAGDDAGAKEPFLQVEYQPLKPGPLNGPGRMSRLPLVIPAAAPETSDAWLAEEARQIAEFFKARGPEALGAKNWSEVCVLAPRNDWLLTVGKAFEKAGLKCALQVRRNRNGSNPAYAWMTGLLAAVCDPDNAFEWFGVLREVFAVSDRVLAEELKAEHPDAPRMWQWADPSQHADAALRGALETLRPFVMSVDNEGVPLGRFAEDLARACGLAEKARLADESGALNGELERLLAEAATLGLTGAGPRDWLRALRERLDAGRPSGKQEDDAVNVLTIHSAKGLEWPVVVPIGFWRRVGKKEPEGMRLVVDDAHGARVFFDGKSVPGDVAESREREHLRELVRLMYVSLTRTEKHLLVPWCAGENANDAANDAGAVNDAGGAREFFGTKDNRVKGLSFEELWGCADLLDALPVCGGKQESETGLGSGGTGFQPVGLETTLQTTGRMPVSPDPHGQDARATQSHATAALPPLPARLLPHQLAHAPVDATRAASHEATADNPPMMRDDDAIDYGLWWHETMESIPWTGGDAAIDAHFESAASRADALGMGERGRAELARLRTSDVFRELREPRWTREAELPVFAPANEKGDAWIDGIMDLVIHDAAAKEARVLDWKTNRRRAGPEGDGALLARLAGEYAPQLRAYGECVGKFFPGARVRLFVFSSAAGKAIEIL